MRDILVGDRNGYTMLFLETGSGLTLADTLRANGVIIDVGNNSNPEVNDWNEDGKKDLLIGAESGTGTIWVYLNQGTDANPVFTTNGYVYRAGSPITNYRCTPRVFDLDGDGLKDIIAGDQYTYLYYFRNTGTNANPVFNTIDTLRLTTGGYISGNQASRIYCTDFNGDGAVDMWVSDFDGYIKYFQNTIVPGVTENEQHVAGSLHISPSVTRNAAVISYTLPTPSDVYIDVYGADGRLVENVLHQNQNAGNHQLTWYNNELRSGIYFFKLKVNKETQTRKVIIL